MKKLLLILFVVFCILPAGALSASENSPLVLTISCEHGSMTTELEMSFLDNRSALHQSMSNAFIRARELLGHRKDEATIWQLKLRDTQKDRTLLNVHFDGEKLPDESRLYEFVLYLDYSERRNPFEYRVYIDRSRLRDFLWDRKEFVERYLERARLVAAGNSGFTTFVRNDEYRELVAKDSWSYEIYRYRRSKALYSGSSNDVDGAYRRDSRRS